MLCSLAGRILCQVAGELLHALTGLPVPGTVLGLVLLLLGLCAHGWRKDAPAPSEAAPFSWNARGLG